MFTIPSSEMEIKWVLFPILGFLLSTFIVGGMNAISETNALCEAIILDWHKCFILTMF